MPSPKRSDDFLRFGVYQAGNGTLLSDKIAFLRGNIDANQDIPLAQLTALSSAYGANPEQAALLSKQERNMVAAAQRLELSLKQQVKTTGAGQMNASVLAAAQDLEMASQSIGQEQPKGFVGERLQGLRDGVYGEPNSRRHTQAVQTTLMGAWLDAQANSNDKGTMREPLKSQDKQYLETLSQNTLGMSFGDLLKAPHFPTKDQISGNLEAFKTVAQAGFHR
ncbi:MAG: hypothetical protein INF44_06265 [Thalassospira sp.]|nr:hypothetical protein [Thalassospira sp.]